MNAFSPNIFHDSPRGFRQVLAKSRRTRLFSFMFLILAQILFHSPMLHAQDRLSELEAFLLENIHRRPGMGIQDVYKLLHQGVFGVGHLIEDSASALAYLESEIARMDGTPDDPLWESCRPDASVLRLNLRPFTQHGGSPTALVAAMIESARCTVPDTAEFAALWSSVGVLVSRGRLPFDTADYRSFSHSLPERSYPVLHHSALYSERWKPAYRVLRRDVAERFFPSLFLRK
ncbi:MAG: hypothetical protein QHI48_04700 [Bacteroidota bacterium]|nr:hypothetical protein [Bacteroidota bacterium]